MKAPRLAALAALLLASLVATAAAAQQRAVSPGDRVRVTSAARPPVRGTVVRTGADGLVLRAGADSLLTPWRDVRALEVGVRGSRTRSALRYGGIGLLTGAAGGALFGAGTFNEPGARDWCILVCERREAALAGAALGAVSGAVVGGVIGAVAARQRWRSATPPATLSAGPAGGEPIAVEARHRF